MSESAAKSFWLSSIHQPLMGLCNLASALKTLELYTRDQLDQANTALETMLTQRGVNADLDTLVAQFDDLKANALEFWAGNYLLEDTAGALFMLSILGGTVALSSRQDATSLFQLPYEQLTFSNQRLSYANADLQIDLQLKFASDLEANASVPPHEMATKDVASVSGTVQCKGPTQPSGQLKGKRNACTAAGLAYDGYGDPAQVWAGSYLTQYIDDDFSFFDLTIDVDASQAVSIRLGDAVATQAMLIDNTAGCTLPTGARIAVQLYCTSQGVRTFTGVTEANGFSRSIVGTARSRHAPVGASRAIAAAAPQSDAAPDFCATNIDQRLTMSSLGAAAAPALPLPSLPVTYADGTVGSIDVAPVRAGDTWRVPPGSLVVYRLLDDKNQPRTDDDALRVAWQVTHSVELLSMAEADYYELRVSIDDWAGFDAQGIDISLAEDDHATAGFITLTASPAGGCPGGTAGAGSPVKDPSKAAVLVSNTRDGAQNPPRLDYRFALSGKSTSADNAAGDHDGFLSATLSFKASNGTAKIPAKVVRIPMLLSVALPVSIRQKLTVNSTFPQAYVGQPYKGELSAQGGVQPYAWQATGTPPSGLSWAASAEGAHLGYTLSGTLGDVTSGQAVSLAVTVQSDTRTAVSRVQRLSPAMMVSSPPAPTVDYAKWAWIIGGTVVSGLVFALISKLIFNRVNAEKLDDKNKAEATKVTKTNAVKAVSAMAGQPVTAVGDNVRTEVKKQPSKDLDALSIRAAELRESRDTLATLAADARRAAEAAGKNGETDTARELLEKAEQYESSRELLDGEAMRVEAQEQVTEDAANGGE